LTLIAWNYPHVYNRVFSSLKPGEDPGQVLEKMLGFSPQALALTIAQRWELAPEILQSLSPSEQCTDEEVRKSGKVIAHVCAIGEAFADSIERQASVSDPDRWKDALDEISKILGPDGTTHLKLLIRRNLSSYARNHPVLSPWAITTESAPQSGSLKAPLPRRELKASELLERNLYVKRCSDAAQTLFKELYDALEPTGISKASLDVLRTKIIPHFGFQRGCIYLLEPVSMVLSPRFVLGKSKTSDYEGVRYNSSQAAFDPIAAAFSSKTPSIEEKQGERSEKICYIACSLGDLQRAGVLYLELSNEQLENHRGTNPLIAFKAIRHVLADILMLK
jgi:hypothetical protein